MQQFLDQASHNQVFHDEISKACAENYYDWKITVLFYIAVHYLRALAAMRSIDIGTTHQEIEKSVNPDRVGAVMRITKAAWRNYSLLYHSSRNARYEGISDRSTFESLMQIDHGYCLTYLDNFKKYVGGQGLPLN